jgi:hypothetical protein
VRTVPQLGPLRQAPLQKRAQHTGWQAPRGHVLVNLIVQLRRAPHTHALGGRPL